MRVGTSYRLHTPNLACIERLSPPALVRHTRPSHAGCTQEQQQERKVRLKLEQASAKEIEETKKQTIKIHRDTVREESKGYKEDEGTHTKRGRYNQKQE